MRGNAESPSPRDNVHQRVQTKAESDDMFANELAKREADEEGVSVGAVVVS